MNNSISILTLIENSCMRHKMFALHGQSLLISYNGSRYLFDVGEDYLALKHNLGVTGIKLNQIRAAAISHKHMDHCGALPAMLKDFKEQKLYLFDDILTPEEKDFKSAEKYRFYQANQNGKLVISLNPEQVAVIKNYRNLIVTNEETELEPGLYLTGLVDGKVKEQAMVIDLDEEGIVVILGCSHPTLPQMVQKAQEVTNNSKVYGIIGGFHFKDSTEEEFSKYVSYLKELNPKFIVPSHCTGNKAVAKLREVMPNIVKVSSTGMLGVGNSIEVKPELKFNFA
jgi:7,8-dihydropterin-6-yl-methyl-4-(beta-D-ribofuranosyl)aminobenzene 5'-phosphate synthase